MMNMQHTKITYIPYERYVYAHSIAMQYEIVHTDSDADTLSQ